MMYKLYEMENSIKCMDIGEKISYVQNTLIGKYDVSILKRTDSEIDITLSQNDVVLQELTYDINYLDKQISSNYTDEGKDLNIDEILKIFSKQSIILTYLKHLYKKEYYSCRFGIHLQSDLDQKIYGETYCYLDEQKNLIIYGINDAILCRGNIPKNILENWIFEMVPTENVIKCWTKIENYFKTFPEHNGKGVASTYDIIYDNFGKLLYGSNRNYEKMTDHLYLLQQMCILYEIPTISLEELNISCLKIWSKNGLKNIIINSKILEEFNICDDEKLKTIRYLLNETYLKGIGEFKGISILNLMEKMTIPIDPIKNPLLYDNITILKDGHSFVLLFNSQFFK